MATIQLHPDFKEFLKLLNSRGVEYLVVKGYAVGYHGFPRATGDMDIWVSTASENSKKIVEALREFGFESVEVSDDLFTQENKIIRMGIPPVRIEIHTSISGVNFANCYERRIRTALGGVETNLISREDLVANKKAAGRHRDLDDLERF